MITLIKSIRFKLLRGQRLVRLCVAVVVFLVVWLAFTHPSDIHEPNNNNVKRVHHIAVNHHNGPPLISDYDPDPSIFLSRPQPHPLQEPAKSDKIEGLTGSKNGDTNPRYNLQAGALDDIRPKLQRNRPFFQEKRLHIPEDYGEKGESEYLQDEHVAKNGYEEERNLAIEEEEEEEKKYADFEDEEVTKRNKEEMKKTEEEHNVAMEVDGQEDDRYIYDEEEEEEKYEHNAAMEEDDDEGRKKEGREEGKKEGNNKENTDKKEVQMNKKVVMDKDVELNLQGKMDNTKIEELLAKRKRADQELYKDQDMNFGDNNGLDLKIQRSLKVVAKEVTPNKILGILSGKDIGMKGLNIDSFDGIGKDTRKGVLSGKDTGMKALNIDSFDGIGKDTGKGIVNKKDTGMKVLNIDSFDGIGKDKGMKVLDIGSFDGFKKDTVKDIGTKGGIDNSFDSVEKDMKERKERIREVCSNYGLGSHTVQGGKSEKSIIKHPPTPNYDIFYIDKDDSLAWCPIYKAASTSWLYTFLNLAGISESYIRNTQRQVSDVARGVWPALEYFEAEKAMDTCLKFLIVRHPFERLVSAFRDKLENTNMGREHGVEHFYKKYGKKIVAKYRKGGEFGELPGIRYSQDMDDPSIPKPKGIEPTFPEFIRYLIDTDLVYYSDDHWMPYYLHCTPCLVDFDIIAKFETLDRDQTYLLHKSGLENKVKSNWKHLTKGRKTSDTVRKYFETITKTELLKLFGKYKLDFELFGYSIDEYIDFVRPG